MKLMIDANVILDVLCERDPFYYESAMVWDLCEAGEVEGCLSVLSFANMVYVMRSSKRDVQFIEKQLRSCFTFADLTSVIIHEAASLEWADFEDAVQNFSAVVNGRIKGIITRNTKDFALSQLEVIDSRQFLIK